jgi:nucleoside-diphosphate-sugar epimerase
VSKVFVTGANGYIGFAVSKALAMLGHEVVAGTRNICEKFEEFKNIRNVAYGDLTKFDRFEQVLDSSDVVVHTAALVHKKLRPADVAAGAFEELNVDVVDRLTAAACQLSVERLIFLSTIAVHGKPASGTRVDEDCRIAPDSAYGRSKFRAEEIVKLRCNGETTNWTIIRPAMVYGVGAPGNFGKLLRLVHRRIPLPVRLIRNQRNFLSIDRLVDLIVLAVERREADSNVFVAADASPVSTPALVHAIAHATQRKAIMWPVAPGLMRRAGRIVGMQDVVSSLVDDFVIDSGKACRLLGWQPAKDTSAEIARYFRR